MARGSNRKKLVEPTITVGSTASSGTTADSEAIQAFDSVVYFVNVTTATAGSITLTIQMTGDDGTTWCTLATAETSGDTGAITATGGRHISATVPLGTRTRLAYTIVTGPFAFTVIPVYAKSGQV
jgi:hypothetical protein